ncbi:MAG: VWA domain-containing protein, partial [Pyrinomonadaceae bacterium]
FINGVIEKSVEITEKSQAPKTPIPPSTVRPEQVRRTIALVVDDLTLSFESTYYVKRALKKFVDEQMQDGDLVAIIRTGAGIGALQQFTTDRRQLYAAIEKVRWNPIGNGGTGAFAPIESSPDDAAFQDENSDKEKSAVDKGNITPENFRASVFATGTLGAINYIVRGMQELPGRKSVMLFSDGFALFTKSENGFVDSQRVLDALKKLVDAANRASVVVYTMDARGLVTTGLTAADDVGGKSPEQIAQSLSDRRTKLFDTQEGLTYLAKETGGLAILNSNDLSGGVRKMLADQSYYLIGYQPDDEVFDPQKRRFNKLEVKVKREGVKVRYRSGFFGVSDEEIAAKPKTEKTGEQKIVNALTSPFAVNEIPLRLNALFGNDAKQSSYIRSFLHIDAENIEFSASPDGKKLATFDILAIAFGDNGVPVSNLGKTFTATVDEQTYKVIKERGIIYDFLFPVKKAGAYQLRVAIYDKNSKKVGSANQFIEIPDLSKKRLAVSGIVVENISYENWEKIAKGQPVGTQTDPISDTALRQFKAGGVLNFGAVVYNPKLAPNGKPDLTTQLKVFKDGKLLYEGKVLPVISNGIIDVRRVSATGSLSLGTQMETGDYILQIVITDKMANKKRQTVSQFVPFEIVK